VAAPSDGGRPCTAGDAVVEGAAGAGGGAVAIAAVLGAGLVAPEAVGLEVEAARKDKNRAETSWEALGWLAGCRWVAWACR
jgi:hypothetical protein